MEQTNIKINPDLNASTGSSPQKAGGPLAKKPIDKEIFVSDDQLVRVKQLVALAQRYPYSDYPCIVIEAYPAPYERIRRIPGGGIELMLTHQEIEALLDAVNQVSESHGNGQLYQILKRIAPKSLGRKRRWRQFNACRNKWRRQS